MDDAWIAALAASPWLVPALFALVVGDAFLVVLPSETAVVALGALCGHHGRARRCRPCVPVAAAGAVVGDALCYLIGRRVGLDRWRWQREGRVGRAIARVRATVHRRTAVLVFTARYVPFARIAVNLAAGAGRVPLRRYLPLSFAAGVAWACYNVGDRRDRRLGASRLAAARDRDLDADRDRARARVDRSIAAIDARRSPRPTASRRARHGRASETRMPRREPVASRHPSAVALRHSPARPPMR